MLLYLLPLFITLGGGYYLIRLRAFFLLHPRKTLSLLLADCKAEGQGSFLRMSLALAGTLGVGNVTGVAAGILVGGAGSVFWLFLSALFSAPLKYAESVAVLSASGEKKHGFPSFLCGRFRALGRPIASLYAVLSVLLALAMGSALQSAAVAETAGALGGRALPFLASLLFSALLLIFIFGSSDKICRTTSVLIPFAFVLYTIICITVIFSNISRLSSAIFLIFEDAFSFRSFSGGAVGSAFLLPLREGFLRGLLSNEAGAATSAYAHAKSQKPSPVAEGILGMGEILFDTVILCMLTAFSILLSVEDPSAYQSGIDLLSAAFFSALGKSYRIPLFVSVFLFALSTAVCWYEYGRCALRFLGQRGGALFFTLYVCAALLGAHLGSMTLIPLCDTLLFFLTVIALPPLLKNATATCALTEQTLHIGKAARIKTTRGSRKIFN
jgi:AGCS family alanine or glycine:cation symporter